VSSPERENKFKGDTDDVDNENITAADGIE